MSIFQGLLGDVFGLTSFSNRDLASISTAKQKEVADYTDKLQRAFLTDQYSLQRQGLEKAGYNPLLALGSSASQEGIQLGAGASSAGSGDGLFSKLASAFQLKQQQELNDSTISKNSADAGTARALADYYKELADSERGKPSNVIGKTVKTVEDKVSGTSIGKIIGKGIDKGIDKVKGFFGM